MKDSTLYITRAAMCECLGACQTGFNAWLCLTNDGELRPRRLTHNGKAVWGYDLGKAVRFLTRFTFKFDADSEAYLRENAFQVSGR